jgi:hypothetical protein
MTWPSRGCLLGAALLLLAACSSQEQITVLTCPQVYIVQDASRFVDWAPGEGRDLIDVRYDARIVNVEWLCTFLTDKDRVDMEVRFAMRALMGPSAEANRVRLPYFVAVADPSGAIIAKEVFGIDIGFPGNALEIAHIESVLQRITYNHIADAAHFTVYIGFQLSPAQLAEMRAGIDP